MISGFKHIDHPIFLVHEHLIYFFGNLFEKEAELNTKELFHNDFLPVLEASNKLTTQFENLQKEYLQLCLADKYEIKHAFSLNNCTLSLSDLSIKPIKYDDLTNKVFAKTLKDFFLDFWKDYPHVNQLENDYGTVGDHYEKLITSNDIYVCPFCGLMSFEPPAGKYREEYDHYLAEALYPFISFNFHFLFPTCGKCNKNEKRADDVLYKNDTRREVYYPYDHAIRPDDLEIIIEPINTIKGHSTLLSNIDWNLKIKRNGIEDDKIIAWDDIYKIKRRYQEHIVRREKIWFETIFTSYKREIKKGVSYSDFKDEFLENLKFKILKDSHSIIEYSFAKYQFANPNFKSFLESQ